LKRLSEFHDATVRCVRMFVTLREDAAVLGRVQMLAASPE
jgi:hypothetical protein